MTNEMSKSEHFNDPGPQYAGEPTKDELAEELEEGQAEALIFLTKSQAITALEGLITAFPDVDPKELQTRLSEEIYEEQILGAASLLARK